MTEKERSIDFANFAQNCLNRQKKKGIGLSMAYDY